MLGCTRRGKTIGISPPVPAVARRGTGGMCGGGHLPPSRLRKLAVAQLCRGLAVAVLPFAAGSAGAGVVTAACSVLGGVERDDAGRGPSVVEALGHEPHGPVDVVEERLEAGAEVIQSRVALGCL